MGALRVRVNGLKGWHKVAKAKNETTSDESTTEARADVVDVVDEESGTEEIQADESLADESLAEENQAGEILPDEIPTEFEETIGTDDTEPADTDRQDEAAEDTNLTADAPSEDDMPDEDTPDQEPLPEAEPHQPAAPEIIRETVVERKGGAGSMMLGGAIAAVLGFGAAQFTNIQLPFLPQDSFKAETSASLAQQAGQIGALTDRIAATETSVAAIDLAPLSDAIAKAGASASHAEASIADVDARLSAELETLTAQVSALDARLTALEKAPVIESVSPEAIAAYEREFEALRNEITAQRAEVEDMAAQAVAAQGDAARQAQRAAARAALAEVLTALEAGDGFAQPLTALETNGVAIPEALAAVAEGGAPTMAALTESFPDAARAALAASRSALQTDGGLGSFLKSALGARSVTPRDGDDPDAVLSRAEAALHTGQLHTALTEIATLPDAGQAALADWTAQAQTRNAALSAARDLAGQLNAE